MSEFVFKLTTPIEDGRATHTQLTLKAPTARVFRTAGKAPFRLVTTTHPDDTVSNEIIFDPGTMLKFLSDMSGIDTITLDDISAVDFGKLQVILFNILNGNPPAPQS